MFSISKLKQEVNEFSPWFRILLVAMGLIYITLWFFTIHLSQTQKAREFNPPFLPAAPKDSQEYVLLSESLLEGNGFATDGRLETLRVPGYPVFVGVIKTIGGSYFAVTLVQIILVFASSLVIRRIGIVFSGKKVGEVAAFLFLINPVTMTLSLLILTDILFLFLFTLGFYLAITIDDRKPFLKICIISSLFISAIYVRGMGIFAIPIFIAPVLASPLSFKMKGKLIGIMLFFIFLSVIPWIGRNYIKTGVASFSSFESENLSFAIPKFLSYMNGTAESAEIAAFQKSTGVPEEIWRDYGARNIIYSRQISKVGERIILDHPFSYLKFHIVTSLPFLFPSSVLFMRDAYNSALHQERPFKYGAIKALSEGDWVSFYNGVKEVWWKFAERIFWLLAYFIALFAVWKGRGNPLAWIFVFICGYLMVLSGPAAGPRLSFQAWPYMFMLFVSGGVILIQKFKSWKAKEL